MSMGHAGERMFDSAKEINGVGAGVGAVIGALLGWPHRYVADTVRTVNIYSYRNAFTQGELSKVLESGIASLGGCALAGAALAYGFLTIYRSGRKPNERPPSNGAPPS